MKSTTALTSLTPIRQIQTQTVSVTLYFVAIARIGSLKTAVVSNIQPLVSILFAIVLFGEFLSPVQFLGGCLVLSGIVLMQRYDSRQAPGNRFNG